jgi:RNA polymerase sigma factor (sigma-70 family)
VAARATQRHVGRERPVVDARVTHVVARYERSLMRVAMQASLCRDDALDAYQRALEIYVRRIDAVDAATEVSWLRVVVKHEALAIRRLRAESVPAEEPNLDSRAPDAQRPVDELLAARERVSRGAEALRRLKPDEAKALMLKAEGHSYKEIGDALGWTYTKTNRAITEGRARFLRVFAEIEAGAECERIAPTLAALVGGTANAEALLELRPHLQHCMTCRATVRKLHESRLGRLAAVWPFPALLAPARWVAGRFHDRSGDGDPGATVPGSPADVYDLIARSHPPSAGHSRPRLAEWAVQRAGDGVSSVKHHAGSAYARAADPTPLAGIRPSGAVAAIAGCLALGGGTTLCVTQGVDPIGGLADVVAPARDGDRAQTHRKRAPRERAAATLTATPAPPAVTPVAVATAEPPEPSPQPTAAPRPRRTPTPTPPPTPEEEYEPVAQAAAASTPAPAAQRPVQTPAPAPAGGAGEFDGP